MECDNRWWAAVRIDGGLCGEMHREFESWYSQLKEKFHFTEKCQAVYFNYDAVIIYLMVGWPGLEELQNQTIFSTLQKGHENNVTFWRMIQMVQGDTAKRVTYWVTWASSWTYPFTSFSLASLPVKCFTREAVKILILILTGKVINPHCEEEMETQRDGEHCPRSHSPQCSTPNCRCLTMRHHALQTNGNY